MRNERKIIGEKGERNFCSILFNQISWIARERANDTNENERERKESVLNRKADV
jgi:hypothetical protein